VVSSRPPNLQQTKEKLKNPQEPNTRAPESQEGLKHKQLIAVGINSDDVIFAQNLKKG
jgi:hypothetical protein